MVSTICLLIVMGIGYAAFSTQLSLKAKGNILKKTINPEKLKESVVDSGNGLYKDIYEEGKYTYKGANPNNYITFNNEIWRIISVSADNTVKIMRNETTTNMSFRKDDAPDPPVPVDPDGPSTNNEEFYKFETQTMQELDLKTDNDWETSDIKSYLNDTYLPTITVNQDKIISHTWSIGKVTPNNSNLADQINNENGTQSQPASVGMITVSEYLRANTNIEQCGNYSLNNSNYSTCRTTDWMFNIIPLSSGWYLWTISPNASNSDSILFVGGYYVGSVESYHANQSNGVSPALYLSSDITLSGTGSKEEPYIITN